jgi:hypothetical protein
MGEAVEYAEVGEAEVDADGVDAAHDGEGDEVELTDDSGEDEDAPQVDDTAEAEEDETDGDASRCRIRWFVTMLSSSKSSPACLIVQCTATHSGSFL